jgi:uncharacterized protein (TIGR02118 family)
MLKSFALIPRKPGTTRAEFARHYEEVHAPLATSLIPAFRGYMRNHVVSALGDDVRFDCLSAFWFDSLDAAIQAAAFSQSDAGKPLRDDEATFLDGGGVLSFLVDERVTVLPPPEQRRSAVKAVALLTRKPGLSREDFIAHYEDVHVPLILTHLPGIVGYARNFVAPEAAGEVPFDSVTEIWYGDRRAYDAALEGRQTEGGRAVERDEETFLDTVNIIYLLVNERVSRYPS